MEARQVVAGGVYRAYIRGRYAPVYVEAVNRLKGYVDVRDLDEDGRLVPGVAPADLVWPILGGAFPTYDRAREAWRKARRP